MKIENTNYERLKCPFSQVEGNSNLYKIPKLSPLTTK
jgi:hypothetical protein